MVTESRAQFDKGSVFATCEEIGEAAVLADLERAGVKFTSQDQKELAWQWVYGQRIKREQATGQALRDTVKYTMLVALGTFLVALFTAGLFAVEFCLRH
jgi:hypothetical protein